MSSIKGKIYNALTFSGNVLINKIPSRHLRSWWYKLLGAQIGKDTVIFRRSEILYPKGLNVGNNVSIGWFTLLDARGGIRIGEDTTIASYAKLITGSHDIDDSQFTANFKPIIIGDHAWIGTGAIILQNVRIGRGAVVAAGAVVTKDVEEFTVVGGIPAKSIKKRNPILSYRVPKAPLLH